MIRDRMYPIPGCHQTRHLKAHHVIPWILGGRTNLNNLILLCQCHHTIVHEGGVTIAGEPGCWVFTKPDGQPCDPWVDEANLARHLDLALRRHQRPEHDHQSRDDELAGVDGFPTSRRPHHPTPLGR